MIPFLLLVVIVLLAIICLRGHFKEADALRREDALIRGLKQAKNRRKDG